MPVLVRPSVLTVIQSIIPSVSPRLMATLNLWYSYYIFTSQDVLPLLLTTLWSSFCPQDHSQVKNHLIIHISLSLKQDCRTFACKWTSVTFKALPNKLTQCWLNLSAPCKSASEDLTQQMEIPTCLRNVDFFLTDLNYWFKSLDLKVSFEQLDLALRPLHISLCRQEQKTVWRIGAVWDHSLNTTIWTQRSTYCLFLPSLNTALLTSSADWRLR